MRRRSMFYVEVDGVPVPVEAAEEWARMFETADRVVAFDKAGPFDVSTVFLGLDHGFGMGPPVLYETMVFGPPEPYKMPEGEPESGSLLAPVARSLRRLIARKVERGDTYRPTQDMDRYCTREQALAGHRAMLERWDVAWVELERQEKQT